MNKTLTVRPHFVYAFTLLYPYLSLLVIPVVREFYRFVTGKDSTLSSFFTAEVAMLIIAFLTAVLKLRRTKLEFCDYVKVQKGLFFKVNYTIPEHCEKVIMLESSPFSRLIGMYRLKIYTEAGRRRRPDEKLPISKKTAQLIFEKYKFCGQAVKSNSVGNVIMSAALSSSFTGFLLAFPIVRFIVSAVGESTTSIFKRVEASEIDPEWLLAVIRALPISVLIGYAVSFLVIFFRNCGFSTAKNGNRIMLDSGILPHRTVFLKENSVNAVKIVTAPLMRLANKTAVKFSACGFGRAKGEIGLLVPCVKPQFVKGLAEWLLPSVKIPENTLSPDKKAIRRCFWLPTFFGSLVISLGIAFLRYSPNIRSTVISAMIITLVIILMWLAARILLVFLGCISLENGTCKAVGRSGFGTVELLCPLQSLERIKITKSPFDRRHGHCSVTVQTAFKNRDKVKVKYLDYKSVLELLEF